MNFLNNATRRKQAMFAATGASAFISSGILFRDLADLSQWVLHADRQEIFQTFANRHKLAALCVGSMMGNTYVQFAMQPRNAAVSLPVWAAVNGASVAMLYSGYFNPEIMMRPRNRNAMFVPASDVNQYLADDEPVIVTYAHDGKPRAFPDTQVLRPHVVRIGYQPNGSQVTMTYCGLTNLGIVYEIPKNKDSGKDVELIPMTQLENNLILLDKNTGHVGQQINGLDETKLMERIGTDTYHDTKRRPKCKVLESVMKEDEMAKPLPTWRMDLGHFVKTYPEGEVFLNDYKMFKSIKNPVRSIYDSILDAIFGVSIWYQRNYPKPVFPTIAMVDPRLPSKEWVHGVSVGDDYVAITDDFVKSGKNGVRNLKVGDQTIVASWDSKAESLGLWRNPTGKPITQNVDVHGKVAGSDQTLERVNNVMAGAYWIVLANFFPHVRVNPEK